ncbi:hypothetical protein PACTADRAFT_47598 [Pachysolen tannophilus NRRL Y-2460]|uniref:protein-serine/threonine phosphatase n=1 Tax=Pachysolen tannophilus NRRL Y-2460 TaxID=669874 RepID=A0A1E4U178_PACTA|nr:hypothetical protein PACTADRAFT_47598 [Pachysolen tannophilus NRRL Y-2460]
MGQLLSQPITEKHIKTFSQKHLSYSIGEMQGYRLTMEDAHCEKVAKLVVESGKGRILSGDDTVNNNNNNNNNNDHDHNDENGVRDKKEYTINIFGVFDGHGGYSTSNYINERLPEIILHSLDLEFNKSEFVEKSCLDVLSNINIPRLVVDSFLDCDYQLYKECKNSGSTAIVSIIVENRLIIGNTGDSRCVLSINGMAKTLSYDHKPNNFGEMLRIRNDGGHVALNRVNGTLALSRAFGDFSFKNEKTIPLRLRAKKNFSKTPPEEYQVTVEPEILIHDINIDQDEFLILACDGIWDCFKNQELIALIRKNLSYGKKINEIVEIVLDQCLYLANATTGVGFDNMTIIIIALHGTNETLDEWYERMKNRVLDEKFGKIL